MELVAALIEGGSKQKILDDWDLNDVERIRAHWAQFGPPTHIAVSLFASAWGVKLTREPDAPSREIPTAGVVGPSIAELASLMTVQPGCDPIEASKLITQRVLGAPE